MRFKIFMRRVIGEDAPEVCTFAAEHFKEAGVPFSSAAGMPLLEAYQLVNQWNRAQHAPKFIYWLEA